MLLGQGVKLKTCGLSLEIHDAHGIGEDIVATAVELTAASIADAYRRFIVEPVSEVLISGGGARNPVLAERLSKLVAPMRVRAFNEIFFDGEAKEAIAFALLAHLHVSGMPGNVPGATGARGFRILGKLTPGASHSWQDGSPLS